MSDEDWTDSTCRVVGSSSSNNILGVAVAKPTVVHTSSSDTNLTLSSNSSATASNNVDRAGTSSITRHLSFHLGNSNGANHGALRYTTAQHGSTNSSEEIRWNLVDEGQLLNKKKKVELIKGKEMESDAKAKLLHNLHMNVDDILLDNVANVPDVAFLTGGTTSTSISSSQTQMDSQTKVNISGLESLQTQHHKLKKIWSNYFASNISISKIQSVGTN